MVYQPPFGGNRFGMLLDTDGIAAGRFIDPSELSCLQLGDLKCVHSLLERIGDVHDAAGRSVAVTPLLGRWGFVGAWHMALSGTPIRAAIFHNEDLAGSFAFSSKTCRRLKPIERFAVQKFVEFVKTCLTRGDVLEDVRPIVFHSPFQPKVQGRG